MAPERYTRPYTAIKPRSNPDFQKNINPLKCHCDAELALHCTCKEVTADEKQTRFTFMSHAPHKQCGQRVLSLQQPPLTSLICLFMIQGGRTPRHQRSNLSPLRWSRLFLRFRLRSLHPSAMAVRRVEGLRIGRRRGTLHSLHRARIHECIDKSLLCNGQSDCTHGEDDAPIRNCSANHIAMGTINHIANTDTAADTDTGPSWKNCPSDITWLGFTNRTSNQAQARVLWIEPKVKEEQVTYTKYSVSGAASGDMFNSRWRSYGGIPRQTPDGQQHRRPDLLSGAAARARRHAKRPHRRVSEHGARGTSRVTADCR